VAALWLMDELSNVNNKENGCYDVKVKDFMDVSINLMIPAMLFGSKYKLKG
jgi:hypothetical protein